MFHFREGSVILWIVLDAKNNDSPQNQVDLATVLQNHITKNNNKIGDYGTKETVKVVVLDEEGNEIEGVFIIKKSDHKNCIITPMRPIFIIRSFWTAPSKKMLKHFLRTKYGIMFDIYIYNE